jgi:death-on-curing protein
MGTPSSGWRNRSVTIEFLTIEEVLAIHADQIARYGGSLGTRDLGLLESALATPAAMFGGQYLHGDIFEMAAAYGFHLVKNHAFIDGNKRVGAVAVDVFLKLNGLLLQAHDQRYYELIIDIACGNADKPAIADFLRANCNPL